MLSTQWGPKVSAPVFPLAPSLHLLESPGRWEADATSSTYGGGDSPGHTADGAAAGTLTLLLTSPLQAAGGMEGRAWMTRWPLPGPWPEYPSCPVPHSLPFLCRMVEYSLDLQNINLSAIRTVRVLRPLKAINRVPSELSPTRPSFA